MKVVVVAGIPGSGSTTVLENTLEELDYISVNYGDVMLEIAIERGLVENRDEIRTLSPDIQKEIQRAAAKSIRERSRENNIIVDTHCTIKTPAGFLPGLPVWVLEELEPDMFILIEADAEEIFTRRISDKTRNRDMESLQEIDLHQQMNRAAAMAYATLTGATVKIVKNHNNQLESAVGEMKSVLM
ncbi:adenylate kinase [Methanothermobacter wolfeii]|uniref:adenylate kinase n=1 Tax=Methanothermobacter wolfeii TaxID=145261 RepID=UPI0024B33F42|nr:adenylate kinase [Methanothermobacter wolfeii]MDI6702387.1 adenylate kinase [Methanothermobacter wolfeii]MDI6841978.1 adenylate kinase [Methanothermobacter wolfeii]